MVFEVKKVSEMHFPTFWRPKFQIFILRCPNDSENSKEPESLEEKKIVQKNCLDKSLLLNFKLFQTSNMG